jgi:hypothetical protein
MVVAGDDAGTLSPPSEGEGEGGDGAPEGGKKVAVQVFKQGSSICIVELFDAGIYGSPAQIISLRGPCAGCDDDLTIPCLQRK